MYPVQPQSIGGGSDAGSLKWSHVGLIQGMSLKGGWRYFSDYSNAEARPLGLVGIPLIVGQDAPERTQIVHCRRTTFTIGIKSVDESRMSLHRAYNRTFRTSSAFVRHYMNAPASRPDIGQVIRPQFDSRRTMATAMGLRLEGKTIVITGASSGIGRSTAMEFARTSPRSLKLVLTARRVDKLKQIAEEIKKDVGEGVQVLPVRMDVSNPAEVKGFVDSLPEEFKEIDILVNNAYV